MIHIDHTHDWTYHFPQKALAAAYNICGKLTLKQEAGDINVEICRYHSDNGIFNSKDLYSCCEKLGES